ncbi:MAG: PilZ domain-containing protein [Candidatus Sulfotelmatobacter sp.]
MLRERRRYFRHPIRMPVTVIVGDKKLKAATTNISEGGIALLLHHAIPKNAKPRVQFTLPGSTLYLDVETEVAWADLKGYVGLRFLGMVQSSQEALENWLTRQMEQQVSAAEEKPAPPDPPTAIH